MRKFSSIFLNTALCILTAIMSVSCLLEKEGPSGGLQRVMIELSVSAGDLTKAALTETEETINSVRVYAFYGDRLAGYISRQTTTSGEPFFMDLELPATGSHNVDFYLVANEEEMAYQNGLVTLSEDMTKAQLEAVRFTGLAERNALPMYCIKTVSINVDQVRDAANTTAGHQGHFVLTQTVAFDLTRSLAKISVYAAKVDGAVSTPQILKTEILAAGTREYSYLFPQEEAVLNAVPQRQNNRVLLDAATSVTASVIKGSEAAKNPSNYTKIFSDAYLPEVTADVVLNFEYTLGEGQPYKYASVTLPKVVRNTHYKICILINAEGQITITYVVAPWEDHPMSDYHFDYPTHSYLRDAIPADNTQEELSKKPASAATMSETVPFSGYFQMTYPDNDYWIPTLLGLHGADCTVRVYEYPGSVEVPSTQWPIQASDKWYRIEVSPNPGKLIAGESVNLAITYKATGFEEVEYLLINGSNNEYYWPYTGGVAQDANYVIITMVN